MTKNSIATKNSTPNIVSLINTQILTMNTREEQINALHELANNMKRPLYFVNDKYSHRKYYSDFMYVKSVIKRLQNVTSSS